MDTLKDALAHIDVLRVLAIVETEVGDEQAVIACLAEMAVWLRIAQEAANGER